MRRSAPSREARQSHASEPSTSAAKHEHRALVGHIADGDRDMLNVALEPVDAVAADLERSEARRKGAARGRLDEVLARHSVGDEVLDGDDGELMRAREVLKSSERRRCAGRAHHRGESGHRLEPGEPAEIDRGFDMPRADEHTTRSRASRKEVSGNDQIRAARVRVGQDAHRAR